MSIAVQKQIKDNSTSVRDYFTDLVRWEEEQDKVEKRREAKKKGVKASTAKVSAESLEELKKTQNGHKADSDIRPEDAIARDKLPMPQYYNKWDQYDPEAEVDKLEEQESARIRAEREVKQAEKDRILDEMSWNGEGDRQRTSKARPKVKINVRARGRKPAPIDLAKPKKEEANTYFAQGRYKEAMVTYTSALDYLEKYEPPSEERPESTEASKADGEGEESEALALKVTLLANRAQALIKLEDWREAIVDCDEALRFDPNHHKAILRRGFALAKAKRWSLAARDLERATKTDPQDRKAAAELQMVRRNLAEQAKEVRSHARALMCDSTRSPTMPTRRLTVKVRRPGAEPEMPAATSEKGSAFQPMPRGAKGEQPEALESDSRASPTSSQPPVANGNSHVANGTGGSSKRPYVPRSVRIRGRQPAPSMVEKMEEPVSTTSAAASQAAPAMNFYAFEAQWSRFGKRPRDRAALLRKVGAADLPALFRESLDAELVASIASVLHYELIGENGGASTENVAYASSVLAALSRTQRFEVSLEALSEQERRVCDEVLDVLEKNPQASGEDPSALRRAFEPPAPLVAPDEEEDEDDVLPPPRPPPEEAVISSASLYIMEQDEEPEDAASTQPVGGVAVFSLDGCD